jgi:hypothetical protein
MLVISSRSRTNRLAIALGLVFFLCIGAEWASADVYYIATGGTLNGGSLYTVDPATGAATLIGPLLDSSGNQYALTGLAFQPGTGVLYGSTSFDSNNSTNSGHLVLVNPTTALVTDIGSFGLSPYSNTNSLPTTCADIKFDPTSGILYCLHSGGFSSSSDRWLYTVSLTTGVATKVGTGSAPYSGGEGLAANSAGTLYATPDGNTPSPNLYTVDKTTGNQTVVGPLGPQAVTTRYHEVDALDFNSAGVLFGILTTVSCCPQHTKWVTIDTSTGTLTVIGPSVDSADALAILKPSLSTSFVHHFSNLSFGDSYIDLTNDGSSLIQDTSGSGTGNICVNVYVFAPDEQPISCCSCLVTPDGLNSLSVHDDLISNVLTSMVPSSVVVKLNATLPPASGCNAAAPGQVTAAGLAAWGTTLHAAPTSPVSYKVTETPFTKYTLGTGELDSNASTCKFLQFAGSGFGICKSCRLGGLGAARQ